MNDEDRIREEVLEDILKNCNVHEMMREVYSAKEKAWPFLRNNEAAMEDAREHYSDRIDEILAEAADEEETRDYETKHAHD